MANRERKRPEKSLTRFVKSSLRSLTEAPRSLKQFAHYRFGPLS